MPLETLSLLKRVSTTFKTVGIMGNNDQDIVDIYAKKELDYLEGNRAIDLDSKSIEL